MRSPECGLNAGVHAALSNVAEAYVELGSPPSDLPSPVDSYKGLLSSSASYAGERQGLVPYVKDHVSWPKLGSNSVDLCEKLPPGDREELIGWKRFFA